MKKPVAIDTDFGEIMRRPAKTDGDEGLASGTGIDEPLISRLARPKGWGVPLGAIVGRQSVRLDAGHYDPKVMGNMDALTSSRRALKPLSELADIDLPGQFVRIWAQDGDHGLPYLNATDLMSFAALGKPAQVRFLSRASNVKMERLIVREGMILVSCSGTIGRVFEIPESLDGWAGTHDIVRVVPHDASLKGYIRAYLASAYAQTQILSHTHGGQIDHITAEQVGSCLVPMTDRKRMLAIAARMDRAERMKQEATGMILQSIESIGGVLDGL